MKTDLVEWDYGRYEGLRPAEIRRMRPGWHLFFDGCPLGERLQEVTRRVDSVLASLVPPREDTLLFGHGHFLRILAARWVGIPPEEGRHLVLASGSFSVLGIDPILRTPVIESWNEMAHLNGATAIGASAMSNVPGKS